MKMDYAANVNLVAFQMMKESLALALIIVHQLMIMMIILSVGIVNLIPIFQLMEILVLILIIAQILIVKIYAKNVTLVVI